MILASPTTATINKKAGSRQIARKPAFCVTFYSVYRDYNFAYWK